MPGGPTGKMRGAMLLLAAAGLAAMVQISATPMAFRLALGGDGASIQLHAASVSLVFDFGRPCPKMGRCLGWR